MLLAATCYLEMEPRQHSEIKFKTFALHFCPSDEKTSAKQPEQQHMEQVLELTQRLTTLYVTAALER